MNNCICLSPKTYLPIIRYILLPISNTTLWLPLPGKSALGNVAEKSAGLSQSPYFIFISRSAKKVLLWAVASYESLYGFFSYQMDFQGRYQHCNIDNRKRVIGYL